MNRKEIERLQSVHGTPCLSILMTTHRSATEHKQDLITLRNLAHQAGERVVAELPRKDAEGLLTGLENLTRDLDCRGFLDGLALFVNKDLQAHYFLPFPVADRVAVDQTFAIRDLVYAMNRTVRYFVLVLSEQVVKLYEATNDLATEAKNGFPVLQPEDLSDEANPSSRGVEKSDLRDERLRQLFRQAEVALQPFLSNGSMPVILVGVERHLGLFDEIRKHKLPLMAKINGSHEKATAIDIGKLVWPIVQGKRLEQAQQLLKELNEAVGARRLASGIDDVWRLAREGRGAHLMVEFGFSFPAEVADDGMRLSPAAVTQPGVIDDAVDDVIETVLGKGGQVSFLPDGTLVDHQRIAMMLRF